MKKSDKPKRRKAEGDELVFRFDGALVTPEKFKRAVESFVQLLLQVTEEAAKGGKKPLWNMSVREGSTVLVARPVADSETLGAARTAIKSISNGAKLLERGTTEIPHFNRLALEAARDLAGLRTKSGRPGITVVEIGTTVEKASALTEKTFEVVRRDLGPQRQDWGSVEGKLQTISERGFFQFVVFDALTDRGINCFVPPDKFPDAYQSFGKRVNVAGLIQYGLDGKPVSIKVEKIRTFRELSELPPISHFRGILNRA